MTSEEILDTPMISPSRARLALTLVSLGISTSYILSMLWVTDSHFVPQVSDLYLIAQYAKGFAEGHPFQFNPGEALTSGATSMLHTVFLALAHFVGFRGEGLIAFAIFSGAIFSLLTTLQAYRAGITLTGSDQVAFVGALMVALNGPLAWSFHYGADIALVLFLSTWLFASWIDESPASTRFVLPACLLALSRPEAAILVVALVFAAVWYERRENERWTVRFAWFLPPLCAGGLAVSLRLMTGSASQTSFSQKLLSANWGWFSAATFSTDYWSDILRGLLLGFYPASQPFGFGSGQAPYYAPPFLLVFVFLALLDNSRTLTRAGWFLGASLATAFAVTPTIHMGIHFNRYLLFALPPLLILFAVGLNQIAKLLGRAVGIREKRVFLRLGIMACLFGLLSVTRFALHYADSAASTYRKDEALFDFIRARLPQDATFLSNGVSIEYRTGRRSLNLSGVVTPGFALILPVETEASAFEILSRPETGELPRYLIAQESYVEGSPAWQALVSGPALFTTSSLDGSEFAIYPTRSELLGRQQALLRVSALPDWGLVDSMNVADPVDERMHDYRFASSVGTRNLYATLKIDAYQGGGRNSGTKIADGGRIILGSEDLSLNTPRSADLWLVVRTHALPAARVRHPSGESRMEISMPESVLRIATDRGRTEWIRNQLEPGWNEIVYRIPAALLDSPRTRLRIEGRYAAYWYAAYQAQPKPGFAEQSRGASKLKNRP